MTAYPNDDVFGTPAFVALRKFLELRQSRSSGKLGSFADFEGELHRLVADCERDILGADLARYDLDAPYIRVDGVRYRKALRAQETYVGQAGPMRVERNLYQPVGGGRTICPLELQSPIVEGAWTPRAARVMATAVAEIPPTDAARIIAEFGGMTPSASSLDRLPKRLSERWEEHRIEWEDMLRAEDRVPKGAVTIAVSIDGVHVPLKKKEVRDDLTNKNGYREAGCGTVSYLDKEGNRLSTVRFSRMPEGKKRTLKAQLEAEFNWAMAQRRHLRIAKLADGAPDNWEFLQELGGGEGAEILDFYHAATHLKDAADAVHGAETPAARALFESWKTTLKEDKDGADKVIRAVRYRRDQAEGTARKTLTEVLGYLRSMRDGMQYQAFREQGLPIGSGVVEAACKTLVGERLKQSGMRWSIRGGQAILTLRALQQSNRWENAWAILASSYKATVRVEIPHQKRHAA